MKKKRQQQDTVISVQSMGERIDLLIQSNLRNWYGKEFYNNPRASTDEVNEHILGAFKANKIRNQMVTEINHIVHGEPLFHFRNYHNY